MIRRVEAFLYRCPVDIPVRASFGVMRDRPALFVRIEDDDGAVGWGEAWCNFPTCGAEHRARLMQTVFAPMLEGTSVHEPAEVSAELTRRTAVLAIQSGEPGPIQQCIAAIDIALWDLAARRAQKPLWKMLGGTQPRVRVYASGINPEAPERIATKCLARGYRAFKLKVGFGESTDVANLEAMRKAIGRDCALMVDANQAWNVATASSMAQRMASFDLAWLEEPLRADRPWSEWRALAASTSIPLAGGENIAGAEAFEQALDAGALRVVQPDAAKWGGISGCLAVAHRIRAMKRRYCPHFLGGGIGLLASAHLLAAAGGDGLLEIDANPNPLRTVTCGGLAKVTDGSVELDDTPGLGPPPELEQLKPYRVI